MSAVPVALIVMMPLTVEPGAGDEMETTGLADAAEAGNPRPTKRPIAPKEASLDSRAISMARWDMRSSSLEPTLNSPDHGNHPRPRDCQPQTMG